MYSPMMHNLRIASSLLLAKCWLKWNGIKNCYKEILGKGYRLSHIGTYALLCSMIEAGQLCETGTHYFFVNTL